MGAMLRDAEQRARRAERALGVAESSWSMRSAQASVAATSAIEALQTELRGMREAHVSLLETAKELGQAVMADEGTVCLGRFC
jgi:hypothetical protein